MNQDKMIRVKCCEECPFVRNLMSAIGVGNEIIHGRYCAKAIKVFELSMRNKPDWCPLENCKPLNKSKAKD